MHIEKIRIHKTFYTVVSYNWHFAISLASFNISTRDAVSSTTGTSSPASDASDVLPYTCIPSTSARGGTPFHASPSPMNSRVPSNVNLPTHSNHCPLEVPIVGYEIMDQRARFTVSNLFIMSLFISIYL